MNYTAGQLKEREGHVGEVAARESIVGILGLDPTCAVTLALLRLIRF